MDWLHLYLQTNAQRNKPSLAFAPIFESHQLDLWLDSGSEGVALEAQHQAPVALLLPPDLFASFSTGG